MPDFPTCSKGSSPFIWQERSTLRQQYAEPNTERVGNSLTPFGAHAALSAYTAQQQTYTHTLILESEAVRPSTHIWSGLALVQISPNQTPRTLFHTCSPSLPLPLQYAWPRRAHSFHPHSHGNSFSLAWGKRQPKVQLAGFTLEILFITLAATLISPSVVLSLSFGGSLLNIFPVLKFMDFSSMPTYIPFPHYRYPSCITTWKLPSWMSKVLFPRANESTRLLHSEVNSPRIYLNVSLQLYHCENTDTF